MSFPKKLNARLSLLLLLFGLVLIGGNLMRNMSWIRERRMLRFEQEMTDMGVRLSGMMQHFVRRNTVSAAELEMAYAAMTPHLELGVVCDKVNKIRFSTHLQWVESGVADSPLKDALAFANTVRKGMTPQLQVNSANATMTGAFPFFEQFHSRDRGVVLLRFDMSDALRVAMHDALWESSAQAAALLAICLLLWLALDIVVTRRVQDLAAYARARVSDADGHAHWLAGDELALVAHSIESSAKELHAAESRLVEAAESERRRIGSDLHDDVCQRVTAAQLKSGVLHSVLSREGHPRADLAGAVADELAKAARVARGFARGLAPMLVERGRLGGALDELASSLAESFGIHCESMTDLAGKTLGMWVDTHVYRIVQELATNAAKHAKPSIIAIKVKIEAETLVLVVESDGQAYAPRKGSGIGMDLVSQRVRALGGQWSIGQRTNGSGGSEAVCRILLQPLHYADADSA